MNAYELAKELDACFTRADWNVLEAATMLRQQADQIAELEKKIQQQALDYLSVCSQADELAGYKESYENCHRMCNGTGMN